MYFSSLYFKLSLLWKESARDGKPTCQQQKNNTIPFISEVFYTSYAILN